MKSQRNIEQMNFETIFLKKVWFTKQIHLSIHHDVVREPVIQHVQSNQDAG